MDAEYDPKQSSRVIDGSIKDEGTTSSQEPSRPLHTEDAKVDSASREATSMTDGIENRKKSVTIGSADATRKAENSISKESPDSPSYAQRASKRSRLESPSRTESASVQQTTEDRLVERIYEKLVTGVSIDISLQMHRMIKTGVYPYSDLFLPKDRAQIFPEIYPKTATEAELTAILDTYATQAIPKRAQQLEGADADDSSSSSGSSCHDDEEVNDNSIGAMGQSNNHEKKDGMVASNAITANGPKLDQQPLQQQIQQPSRPSHFDIWGRQPPKEPKELVLCTICGRQVSTLRFAPHLDKCMGIGTSMRAAAAAATAASATTSSRGALSSLK